MPFAGNSRHRPLAPRVASRRPAFHEHRARLLRLAPTGGRVDPSREHGALDVALSRRMFFGDYLSGNALVGYTAVARWEPSELVRQRRNG